jgi:vesicle-fusing ATPase
VHNVKPVSADDIRVTLADFEEAIGEVTPAYGVDTNEFEQRSPQGILSYGPRFDHLHREARRFVELVRDSERTPLMSVLLEGAAGTGKTALAATVAMASGFPYIKFVSAESFVGATEAFKLQKIAKVFEDAYKTPLSCVVLDDIERLVEYVPMGQRFSNNLLQTLLVSLKRVPPKGRRMLVIGTSSSPLVLQDMTALEAFTATLHVPKLSDPGEIERLRGRLYIYIFIFHSFFSPFNFALTPQFIIHM